MDDGALEEGVGSDAGLEEGGVEHRLLRGLQGLGFDFGLGGGDDDFEVLHTPGDSVEHGG